MIVLKCLFSLHPHTHSLTRPLSQSTHSPRLSSVSAQHNVFTRSFSHCLYVTYALKSLLPSSPWLFPSASLIYLHSLCLTQEYVSVRLTSLVSTTLISQHHISLTHSFVSFHLLSPSHIASVSPTQSILVSPSYLAYGSLTHSLTLASPSHFPSHSLINLPSYSLLPSPSFHLLHLLTSSIFHLIHLPASSVTRIIPACLVAGTELPF